MAGNVDMNKAKSAKNDEFYTLYSDIQKEINAYIEYNPDVFRDKVILLPCDDPDWSNFTKFFAQNFENFGIKKLISTSYALDSKYNNVPLQLSLFETQSPKFDETKTNSHGKIFTLTRDTNNSGRIDIEDLEWDYLEGDGDFRSNEVKALRDEADIIITNPPFSLFREFLSWITNADKEFLIIGNINCISYVEVFNLIKNNKAWLGNGMGRWISGFVVPDDYELYGTEARVDENGNRIVATNNCLWLTNIEHGRRKQPLALMTKTDNIKFSKHKQVRNIGYKKYDNYDAINVPFTDAIPSDYDGNMGVPITFLDKYCPEQFEIVDANDIRINDSVPSKKHGLIKDKDSTIDGKPTYARLVIRRKR
ncbi:MAG: adenine-specific methyltransferase EcoRI family protein [Eubacteriales bacterium]|nr:adenine-specific methyltransferase EcoRI family protein [Eubacteriales bacterium]